jgi:hypothetical protein
LAKLRARLAAHNQIPAWARLQAWVTLAQPAMVKPAALQRTKAFGELPQEA